MELDAELKAYLVSLWVNTCKGMFWVRQCRERTRHNSAVTRWCTRRIIVTEGGEGGGGIGGGGGNTGEVVVAGGGLGKGGGRGEYTTYLVSLWVNMCKGMFWARQYRERTRHDSSVTRWSTGRVVVVQILTGRG